MADERIKVALDLKIVTALREDSEVFHACPIGIDRDLGRFHLMYDKRLNEGVYPREAYLSPSMPVTFPSFVDTYNESLPTC
jgi:hypothetical protein